MAKRMLADVLWEAANVHLGVTGDEFCHCSCNAVAKALSPYWCWIELRDYGREVHAFLESLGCVTDREAFLETSWGPARQAVRYMWLLLAMHVAEDEGIEVEA